MNNMTPSLSRNETVYGLCWLAISQLLLPSLLVSGNALLASPLSSAKLNFVYYCINFSASVWIFRSFLHQSWKAALRNLFLVIWFAVLGYLGCEFLTNAAEVLIFRLDPSFFNANNQAVLGNVKADFSLMVIATVLMVPVSEELLFRGVIFRGLLGKSRALAYGASMVLFAAMHCIGYLGTYSPLQLVLALVQYLPAGYCLCFVYHQTGTIVTPIVMHALVNAMTIYNSVR